MTRLETTIKLTLTTGGSFPGEKFLRLNLGRLCGTGQNQFWVRGRRRQSDHFQGKSIFYRYLPENATNLPVLPCPEKTRTLNWKARLSPVLTWTKYAFTAAGEVSWLGKSLNRAALAGAASLAHSHQTNDVPPRSTLPPTAGTMGRGSGEKSSFERLLTNPHLVDSSSNLIHCHLLSSSKSFDHHLIGKYAPLLPDSGEARTELVVVFSWTAEPTALTLYSLDVMDWIAECFKVVQSDSLLLYLLQLKQLQRGLH